jgi:hypothetical protein
MKGYKGLHKGGDKSSFKSLKAGSSNGGSKKSSVLAEAREGMKGGGQIGGGSGPTMGRKRGGACRSAGGMVGADKHPFSSAHSRGGSCK